MATTERLPWSQDAPPAKAAAPAAPGSKAGSMWPWYILLLLIISGVGAGAWWLSQAREAPPPELPAEQSLPNPVTPAPAAEVVPAVTPTDAEEPASADPDAQSALDPGAAQSPRAVRPPIAFRPNRTRERRAERSLFPADEPVAAPPAIEPIPAIAYNPRPYGGRVVQLGAFPTRTQAEDSWKRITRRYPYLETKSKMVNTVDVQGLGGGRPTRMYRLQLGTSSQAQSVVICQQLERAGHSCVVVY